jgi:hypothetical protein
MWGNGTWVGGNFALTAAYVAVPLVKNEFRKPEGLFYFEDERQMEEEGYTEKVRLVTAFLSAAQVLIDYEEEEKRKLEARTRPKH